MRIPRGSSIVRFIPVFSFKCHQVVVNDTCSRIVGLKAARARSHSEEPGSGFLLLVFLLVTLVLLMIIISCFGTVVTLLTIGRGKMHAELVGKRASLDLSVDLCHDQICWHQALLGLNRFEHSHWVLQLDFGILLWVWLRIFLLVVDHRLDSVVHGEYLCVVGIFDL